MTPLKSIDSLEQHTSWEPINHSAIQKLSAFYGTRKFITVLFTRAHHCARWI